MKTSERTEYKSWGLLARGERNLFFLPELLNSSQLAPGIVSRERLYKAAVKTLGNGTWECCRTLKAHTGCVNALAFSNDGRLMASGGDDLSILIWPVDEHDTAGMRPAGAYRGHHGNVFSISFDSTGGKFFSCGEDGMLLHYDVRSSATPIKKATDGPGHMPSDVILAHEQAVIKLSLSPRNDNLVLTAGQDSSVKLYDMRCSDQLQGQLSTPGRAQNSVAFNPIYDNFFVTSDDRGGVFLRDLRSLRGRSTQTPHVIQYATQLSRGGELARQADVPSVAWSPDGRYVGAVINKWYPTLYTIGSADPSCVLKTPPSNDHSGFRSVATIKTGVFGGIDNTYFYCGSDDFRGYAWKVPSASEIQDFTPNTPTREFDIVYMSDGKEIRPMEVHDAQYVLKGHRSIINSVLPHPHRPLIATAGIEKVVRLFSPFLAAHQPDSLDSRLPRDLDLEEDPETMLFFDRLLTGAEFQTTLWSAGWADSDMDTSSDEDDDLHGAWQFISHYDPFAGSNSMPDELSDVEEQEDEEGEEEVLESP